jgi:hypothetical protein
MFSDKFISHSFMKNKNKEDIGLYHFSISNKENIDIYHFYICINKKILNNIRNYVR